LPDIREVPQPALRDDESGIDPDMSAQSPMVEGERRGVFGTAGRAAVEDSRAVQPQMPLHRL